MKTLKAPASDPGLSSSDVASAIGADRGPATVESRGDLAIENLALLKRETPRPRLRKADRAFWVFLEWWWYRWRDALIIVKPEMSATLKK